MSKNGRKPLPETKKPTTFSVNNCPQSLLNLIDGEAEGQGRSRSAHVLQVFKERYGIVNGNGK